MFNKFFISCMTIDKKEVITLPKWLVILVLPMIVSLVVSFGLMSETKATLETKAHRNEAEIQKLYDQKTDRNEMNLLINTLNRIENKLDSHIDKKQ